MPKKDIEVDPRKFTSEKTTPRPVERAGWTVLAGLKNSTIVVLLPIGVNRRSGLKGSKKPGLPNCIGSPDASVELSWKPLPGVENSMPRATGSKSRLKKSPGNALGSATTSGAASQSICRRPPAKFAGWFGLSAPRSSRNASTVGWMLAASGPVASWIAETVAADEGTAPTALRIKRSVGSARILLLR